MSFPTDYLRSLNWAFGRILMPVERNQLSNSHYPADCREQDIDGRIKKPTPLEQEVDEAAAEIAEEDREVTGKDGQMSSEARQQYTPGPWNWRMFGSNHALTTAYSGSIIVMDFIRHGMRGAQPRFGIRSAGNRGGIMKPASEMDISSHPDAVLIAASPDLLAACEAALNFMQSGSGDLNEHHRHASKIQEQLEEAVHKAKGL